jgi:CubicO group peptidase (beta-lactamase class C family)
MNTINGNSASRPGMGAGSADRAQEVMEEVALAHQIPGMTVAVATPDALLYAGAVGYADLADRRPASIDDQYPWFSMSKIATATTAMRLHRAGVLDLDAPIGNYLPDYRPHPKHGHPTTRHLLTHTAGLSNPVPVRWVRPEHEPADDGVISRIIAKHGTPVHVVGQKAKYSNIGYLLAGEVITATSGHSVEDNVRRHVLGPLSMTATGYDYRADCPRSVGYVRVRRPVVPLLRAALPRGIVGHRVAGHNALNPFLINGAAFGGLVGTVTDAVRLAAIHAAGPDDPEVLLGRGDIESMRTIVSPGKRFDHGIGWFRKPGDADRTPGFVEHYGTGCGYWNAMRIYPGRRLAMVAMTNTTFAWDADGLFTRLEELS